MTAPEGWGLDDPRFGSSANFPAGASRRPDPITSALTRPGAMRTRGVWPDGRIFRAITMPDPGDHDGPIPAITIGRRAHLLAHVSDHGELSHRGNPITFWETSSLQ